MSELNLSQAITTNFTGGVPNFIVESKALDFASPNQEESYWYFADAIKYFGYYFNTPEIHNANNALNTWAFGRGYNSDPAGNGEVISILKRIDGIGFESFDSIIQNLGIVKNTVGDSFAEIKWNGKKNIPLNLITISPERVRLVFGKTGLLKRYDVWNGSKWTSIEKENMLHLTNNRIGDQIHGTSKVEAAKKIIDAINEALDDERIIKHRDKALGIAYYQTDKAGKIAYANAQIEKAVKNGEMVGLPEGTVKIEPYPSRSSEDRTGWISY